MFPYKDPFADGSPTLLETYKHQCVLLETELNEAYRDIQGARNRIARLVQITEELTRQRDALRADLARFQGGR